MRSRVVWAALLAWICLVSAGRAADRPNIVFILADDLGVNDLHCYGRADHATPNLDKLAGEGIRFTSAYCAQPICSASRAAIMTGKPPAQLHLTTFLPGRADAPSQLLLQPKIRQQLPLEEVTIAETLREAGYRTACIGKWHLGGEGFSPLEQGFDVYEPGQANTEPSASEGGKGEFDLTKKSIAFVEADRDKPFFLYLAHNNPHIPLSAQQERIAKHPGAYTPTYAATVETLDEAVGRLVRRIEELGLREKTLIVFTSDNGGLHVPEGELTPATHNAPFRAGKGFLYEGGLRIPLIVRWPGVIPPGRVAETPVVNTSWNATLREIVGVTADATRAPSIAPALRGESPEFGTLCWHFPHYTNQGSRPAGAIREGTWKLIEHYEEGRLELFDLEKDLAEAHDVSADEPSRVAELRGKLEEWRRANEVQRNEVNPDFDLARWKPLYGERDVSLLASGTTFTAARDAWQPWRRKMNDALQASPGGGAVILQAKDAVTHGEKLQYEFPPHKDTLGYWVNVDDWAEWSFTPPSSGNYEVQVLQGCGTGSGGAEVEIRVGDAAVTFTVQETGHFQRFVPRTVGTLRLAGSRPLQLTLRAKSKPNVAVMDLRRITLRRVE